MIFLFASMVIRSPLRLKIRQISFFMFSVSLGVVLVVASPSYTHTHTHTHTFIVIPIKEKIFVKQILRNPV